MKKLIGTVAALLLVASAAFAELSAGAWLRSIWAPVNSDGDETIYGGISNSWGGTRWSRLDFRMTSDDGKAGLAIGLYDGTGTSVKWDNGTAAESKNANLLSVGDDYRIWVKPIDMLTVSLGAKDNGDFLAALCYGSWDWLRPNNAVAWGEDIAFGKICNQPGVLLELTPIENLLISWNIAYGNNNGIEQEAYEAFQKQDIGVRYGIEGIGTIKAGWKGHGSSYDGDAKYMGDVCFAFELSAVENLNVVFGGFIPVANSDYKDASNLKAAASLVTAATDPTKIGDIKEPAKTAQFGLGASYAVMDNFTVYGDFGIALYNGDSDLGPAISFGLGLDYGIMDNLTLNVDFRGYIPPKYDGTKILDPDFSFLVGVKYACSSNGYIGAGFQGFIAGEASYKAGGSVYKATADKFAFAVPVAVSVWF